MSDRLPESEKTDCYYGIIDRLYSLSSFVEFIRLAGLPEAEISEIWDDNRQRDVKEKKYQLLDRWCTKTGRFCVASRDFLLEVEKEVTSCCFNRNNDGCLRNHAKMRESRQLAWFLYAVIRNYSDDGLWDRLQREKLRIPDAKLSQLSADLSGNSEERKYQALLFWKQKNEISNVPQLAREWKNLDINIPDGYIVDGDGVHVQVEGDQIDIT